MYTYLKLLVAHSSKNSDDQADNGFTMLEVIVVAVLIGILSAIAAPSWLGFVNTRRLNTSQSQVYQAMREAQSEAKKQKLTWQFSFREQNNIVQWAVHPATDSPSNWNNLEANVKLDAETNFVASNGISKMQFDYIGSTSLLRTITLSSKSGGKAKRCVIVSTLLGTIRTAKENSTADSNGKYCY